MLLNDFFSVHDQHYVAGNVTATLLINKDHGILKGHFPGQPVVPGVCMMQMIKELVELQTNRDLRISEADNMKFLSIINPELNNKIQASITYIENNGALAIN